LDLYVKAGKIVQRGGKATGRITIDATGLAVLPGVIDAHVHIPDPDVQEREDFITGTTAAASNGTAMLIEHHHSLPVKEAGFLREKAAYLSARSLIDFGLLAVGHPDNIDRLEELWRWGAYGFKVFTCSLHGAPAVLSDTMLEMFRAVAAFGGYCLVHCEDDRITAANERRLRGEGKANGDAILAWRTLEAEMVGVTTTALLARITGARIGIAHVSHPAVIDLIERERAAGARISIESCPHYFYLTERDVRERGPWAKFTPPARSADVASEMWRHLEAGQIDMISADHAPATREEKSRGEKSIWEAPFGIPGVETTLSLMLNGVSEGRCSLKTVVRVMSEGPARVYGLHPRKGNLEVGADADMVLVDLEAQRRLEDAQVRSKVGWTPYAGRLVKGLPVMTIARGRVIFKEGQVVGEPGWGRYIPRPGSDAEREG
jgi:dihydroorotase (multifunctional complex type)